LFKERRGFSVVLPLVFYGAEALRQRAAEVEAVTDELRLLAEQMIETMLAAEGIGLAANQVGVLKRIFVMRRYQVSDDQIVWGESQVCINPIIKQQSSSYAADEEGCLSIPGIRADVVRPVSILLQWIDLEGVQHEELLEHLQARIAMHEIDHLDGKLFIDRVSSKKKRALTPMLKKLEKASLRQPI